MKYDLESHNANPLSSSHIMTMYGLTTHLLLLTLLTGLTLIGLYHKKEIISKFYIYLIITKH